GWAIFLRQKQKKLIMLPSEIMIWQPEFTDKILSRKPGAVHIANTYMLKTEQYGKWVAPLALTAKTAFLQ
ncbi:hypothetical protein ACVFBK_004319, partial [Escherichia coli]